MWHAVWAGVCKTGGFAALQILRTLCPPGAPIAAEANLPNPKAPADLPLAVHPAEPGKPGQELYLLCEDIDRTVTELESKGITIERPFHDERWGRLTFIRLPGGGKFGIYSRATRSRGTRRISDNMIRGVIFQVSAVGVAH